MRRERIAEHLRDMGIEVTLMDTTGVDVFPVIKEALTGDYDVIAGTVRLGVPIGYTLSRVLRKPFIGSVSDLLESQDYLSVPVYRLMCFVEWWVLKRADAVFFAHPKSYEDALKRGIEGSLVRNSVNYDAFADPDDEVLEEAYDILTDSGVDTEKEIAIYIGSLIENGYFGEIVEAAKQTPDWEFVFVGTELDVDMSQLVSGVENAHFLGEYDHELMPGFLHHSSAAFCLVDNEVPLKITEYGAAGLPTLGYPGKLKSVFSEDELIYVEPEPEKISEELQRLSSDPEYAQKYAENLRDYARENRWEDVANEYYESMQKLTEGDHS
ncbi:glycosyltransferase [Haladaptatus sp. F3-133]|uniref:Glycosyltransferase n=1 Tax=Halorutilus salinus TaxID=2487751 RepID=A0A9Q4C367_9EURY|nr:glycosyltransferase [Halorutilus salinus]